jgi:hypothetical protein
LQLKNLRLPAAGQTLEDISEGIDYFSVRGEIISQDPNTETIAVRLCRNLIPPGKELRKKYQPFTLAVEGFLPGNLNGQFWEFDVCREGNKRVLKDAAFVAQIVLDIQLKVEPAQGNDKKQSGESQEKKQADKMQPVAKPPLNLVLKKNKNG